MKFLLVLLIALIAIILLYVIIYQEFMIYVKIKQKVIRSNECIGAKFDFQEPTFYVVNNKYGLIYAKDNYHIQNISEEIKGFDQIITFNATLEEAFIMPFSDSDSWNIGVIKLDKRSNNLGVCNIYYIKHIRRRTFWNYEYARKIAEEQHWKKEHSIFKFIRNSKHP
jgi:hypothetical protein